MIYSLKTHNGQACEKRTAAMINRESIMRKSCGERFDLTASVLVERNELIEEDRPLREAFSKRKLTEAGPSRERRNATRQRKSRADFVGSWTRAAAIGLRFQAQSRAGIVGSWMAPPQLGLWFQRKFSNKRIFRYGNQIQPTRADLYPRSIY